MKRLAALICLAALAGCGVDGEPVPPTVTAGLSVTPSGVQGTAGVAVTRGPVTVHVGL